jgi:hypothetical protein
MAHKQRANAAADGKTCRQPHQPAHRYGMAALTIVAHAGQARGHHLCDQRDALSDVLVLAEDQHQQRHQNAAAGDAEEAGCDAADATGQQPTKHIIEDQRQTAPALQSSLSKETSGREGEATAQPTHKKSEGACGVFRHRRSPAKI